MGKVIPILLLSITLFSFVGCEVVVDLPPQVDKNTILFSPDGYEPLFTHGNLHDIEIVITRAEWKAHLQDIKDYESRLFGKESK